MNKLILVLLLFPALIIAQVKFSSVGISLGGGSISANSPKVTTYSAGAYFEVSSPWSDNLFIRPQALYSRDLNILFPENRKGKNYSYIYGGGVDIVNRSTYDKSYDMEYSGGIIAIKDKTYSDINNLCYGIKLGAAVHFNIADYTASRLLLGVSADYGQTFTKTTPGFLFISIGLKYKFT